MRLYYEVHGEKGPPVVLCDGLGCNGFAWRYLLPALRRKHRVIRWHYRGHGSSEVPDHPRHFSIVHNCEDLSSVLDHTGAQKAVLVGHSLGVQVILEYHRRHADRVAGLALVCGSYGRPLDTFHDGTFLRSAFPVLRETVELFPQLARKVNAAFMRTSLPMQIARFSEINADLIDLSDLVPYFDHLARMDPVAFVRTLDSVKDHTAWEHLPSVDVPTLVVAGEHDSFTPAWLSQRMAERIPRAQLLMVPGGTHAATLERPGLVNRHLLEFLERALGPQTGARS